MTKLFITANTNASKEAEHILTINDKEYIWKGPYMLTETNTN